MKKLFSFRLYVEGLKRVRLLGIAAGIVISLMMIVQAVSNVTSLNNLNIAYDVIVDLSQMEQFAAPLILLLAVTPFFIHKTFSFLNKRKAADFYHSIPHHRLSLYFSNLAAVYTWIYGILIFSVGISMIYHSTLSVFCINWTMVNLTILLFAVATLFLGGFMLLAMTLTGKAFSNGVLFLVLALSFRVLGWIIVSHLEANVPLADFRFTILKIFSMKTSIFVVGANGFDNHWLLNDPLMWIYTACTTVLLYALAAYFFVKRKSETAGKTCNGKGLQHFYSCAFSMPLALLTTTNLTKYGFEKNVGYTALLAASAIVVFYLCELFSYKKILYSLKATPLFGAVILLCGAFAGGTALCKYYVASRTFSPDEVESVQFYHRTSLLSTREEDSELAASRLFDFPFYTDENIEIHDRAFVEAVCDLWSNTKGNSSYYSVIFRLKNGSTVGRRITIPDEATFDQLQEKLFATQEYRKAYVTLIKEHTSLYSYDLDDYVSEELANTFWKEYGALSEDEKFEYWMYCDSETEYLKDCESYLADTTYSNSYLRFNDPILAFGQRAKKEYAVLTDIFPKTKALLYADIAKKKNEELSELKELLALEEEERLKTFLDGPKYDLGLTINWNGLKAEMSLFDNPYRLDYNELLPRRLEIFEKILSNASENLYDTDGRYKLSFSDEVNSDEGFRLKSYTIGYDMDMEVFKEIVRIGRNHKLTIHRLDMNNQACLLNDNNHPPFHVLLWFSNGEEYHLSVTNENFERFKELWKEAYIPINSPREGASVGDEGTVEVFISDQQYKYYQLFTHSEFSEELKEKLKNFS